MKVSRILESDVTLGLLSVFASGAGIWTNPLPAAMVGFAGVGLIALEVSA